MPLQLDVDYREERVLPLACYEPLSALLMTSLACADMAASPAVELARGVKNKDVVAQALVQFFAAHGQVRPRHSKHTPPRGAPMLN